MKKKYKRKLDWTGVLLLGAGLAMIIVALRMLVPILADYKQSNDTYDDLEENYVVVKEDDNVSVDEETSIGADGETWWYEDVEIQLSELQKLNGDIIGWIRFDNIEIISYPILYSGDDMTYLRTDIYGNSTTAGCIFMEGLNTPDFSDSHTIIYGHNMKNGSMFGSLKKYKTEDFYEENQYFTIYTEDTAYRYQIFSYRDVSEIDEIYRVCIEPDETFVELLGKMQRGSYIDTGVEVTKEDKVVTLSTCSTKGNRFVVHAICVDAKPFAGGAE